MRFPHTHIKSSVGITLINRGLWPLVCQGLLRQYSNIKLNLDRNSVSSVVKFELLYNQLSEDQINQIIQGLRGEQPMNNGIEVDEQLVNNKKNGVVLPSCVREQPQR